MFVVDVVNLFLICEIEMIYKHIVENCIEIDRSEADQCEFIHESCIFSLLLIQLFNFQFNFSIQFIGYKMRSSQKNHLTVMK